MTALSTFERAVERVLQSHSMLIPGDQAMVAVSGGPDSVALLSVLLALRPSWDLGLRAVHFDHGLRGIESQHDAKFVKDFCDRMGVDLTLKNLDLQRSMARERGESLQQFASKVRYEALFSIADEFGAKKIAIGHTADDQAETVLMWMIRGSGTGGLGGMSPVRNSCVIRPLLGFSRADILGYLRSRELGYRIDSSNLSSLYFRNRLRHELIPVLKRYNPNLIKVLSRQADIVREDHRYLEQLAAKAFSDLKQKGAGNLLIFNRAPLLALPLAIQRRVLRLALQTIARMTYGPRFGSVEMILDHIVSGQSGSSVVSHGVRVTREYENILFDLVGAEPSIVQTWPAARQTVHIPSQITWPLTGQTIEITVNPVSQDSRRGNHFHVNFDAATFSHPLVLRTWQPGDQFCPLGLGGRRKKLKNFFSDIKLERSQRERVPLLVAPEGILWVGGYRADHRFRVTEATREVLTVTLGQGSL
jgi:tRNA(Ile)-lysidine synthase